MEVEAVCKEHGLIRRDSARYDGMNGRCEEGRAATTRKLIGHEK